MRKMYSIFLLILLLAACGGDDDPNSQETAPPVPTTIPTYSFVQPTQLPALATAGAATAAANASTASTSLEPEAVELGRGRYVALECGSCHGENGEGTEDGSALTEFAMSEEEFIGFMRSGGDLGSEHQFATNRLSANGGKNLYQYLLSLSQGS